MRSIFDLYTRDRLGGRVIATTLNERGHRTTTRARYDTSACDAPRLDADAVDDAVLGALAGFYRTQRGLIAEAVERARLDHQAAHGDRHAELTTIDAELDRNRQATDRYLLAFERGTLDEELVAERLNTLKATARQLAVRRDELATMIDDAPSTPDAATLDQVADHLAEIIASGTPNQRKALVEALIARVIITAPDQLTPVFRVPQADHDTGAAPAQPAGTAPDAVARRAPAPPRRPAAWTPRPGLPSGDRLGGSSELVALPSRVAMCGRVLPLVMPRSLPLDHDDLEMLGSCGIPSTWQRPTARRPGGSPPPSRTLPREALPSDRRVVARGEVDGMRTLPTHLDTALPGRSGHPGDQPRGERMHVVRCSRLQLRRDLLQAV